MLSLSLLDSSVPQLHHTTAAGALPDQPHLLGRVHGCSSVLAATLVLRVQVLRWLLAAQGFEQFLSRKFPASKRFGLEGCEALLPGLLALVEEGAVAGLRKVSWAHPPHTLGLPQPAVVLFGCSTQGVPCAVCCRGSCRAWMGFSLLQVVMRMVPGVAGLHGL